MNNGAAFAILMVGIRGPLTCTEYLAEVRGSAVQSSGSVFEFGGRRAAVGGGEGAAGGGGGHVGAQFLAGGAVCCLTLFSIILKCLSSRVRTLYWW